MRVPPADEKRVRGGASRERSFCSLLLTAAAAAAAIALSAATAITQLLLISCSLYTAAPLPLFTTFAIPLPLQFAHVVV